MERVRSTQVMEVLNDTLFVGLVDQERWRVQASAVYHPPQGGRWRVGYEVERVEGAGFVPGPTLTQHRVVLERQGVPYVLWGAE